jgi:hypothetical protein
MTVIKKTEFQTTPPPRAHAMARQPPWRRRARVTLAKPKKPGFFGRKRAQG